MKKKKKKDNRWSPDGWRRISNKERLDAQKRGKIGKKKGGEVKKTLNDTTSKDRGKKNWCRGR